MNMITKACGNYYKKFNIIMVSVDTGWNNMQQPNSYEIQSPLDCIDGAARILDPIFSEIKRPGIYKDYKAGQY